MCVLSTAFECVRGAKLKNKSVCVCVCGAQLSMHECYLHCFAAFLSTLFSLHEHIQALNLFHTSHSQLVYISNYALH